MKIAIIGAGASGLLASIIASANSGEHMPHTLQVVIAVAQTVAECADGIPPAPVRRSALKLFVLIKCMNVFIICAVPQLISAISKITFI